MKFTSITIISVTLAVNVAVAQPADDGTSSAWVKRQIGRSYMCNTFTGHCAWEPRYGYTRVPVYTHPHRPAIGYYPTHRSYASPPIARVDNLNEGPRCLDRLMSAVGPEAFNVDKAKEAADSMLMETIRAKFGSRYMDLRFAEALTYECWRSATGNRISEKAADFGGGGLQQCQITGRPCRSKQEVADTGDAVTDQAIRRLEQQGFEVRPIQPESRDAPKKPRIIRRWLKSRE